MTSNGWIVLFALVTGDVVVGQGNSTGPAGAVTSVMSRVLMTLGSPDYPVQFIAAEEKALQMRAGLSEAELAVVRLAAGDLRQALRQLRQAQGLAVAAGKTPSPGELNALHAIAAQRDAIAVDISKRVIAALGAESVKRLQGIASTTAP